MNLEEYFKPYRDRIIGIDLVHKRSSGPLSDAPSPGNTEVIYADWTASGRLYGPIESFISHSVGPYVANTHTETTLTGTTMTHLYHEAGEAIKKHVGADDNDVYLSCGTGMTGAINKFQRILGLRIPERLKDSCGLKEEDKPVVFITHMEHHSNQTTWCECEVTLQIIRPDAQGVPDLAHLKQLLEEYRNRPLKIGAFSACSNVTGILTPYHEMAKLMHAADGLCFVDFAASAPYVDICMHPAELGAHLDAIYFSPHKFLGGPGSSGALVFNRRLYQNTVPDEPGGGTVAWTNPWGEHRFYDSVETREDGGTPGFLQTIRTALAISLKESMGVDHIHKREAQLTKILMDGLSEIPEVTMLEEQQRNRLCIVSFYMTHLHYNLIVRLLNDRFGIQTRGGCSCAGTYGHILLNVDNSLSKQITSQIDQGDLSTKPGWVRVSLHPTSTDEEAHAVVRAIGEVAKKGTEWAKGYRFNSTTGEFQSKQHNHLPLTLGAFSALPELRVTTDIQHAELPPKEVEPQSPKSLVQRILENFL